MEARRVVPVAVTARNEEVPLPACLQALRLSLTEAERRETLPPGWQLRLCVVLDDCTDGSEAIARAAGAQVLVTRGGKLEAQRCLIEAFPDAPFVVFSDADVAIDPETLSDVLQALLDKPGLRVAYPTKHPLPPARRHLLARALHVYNRNRGLQTRRLYFNGMFFAIRGWSVPNPDAIAKRAHQLPKDGFYDFESGLRVDDIYLSRRILADDGPEAIHQVPSKVWFRPPETFEGMYRTYLRMRREIERLDVLFPGLAEAHRRWGRRRHSNVAYRQAPSEERFLWWVFQAFLQLCKLRYHAERRFYRHRRPMEPWRPIAESKVPVVRP